MYINPSLVRWIGHRTLDMISKWQRLGLEKYTLDKWRNAFEQLYPIIDGRTQNQR